MIETKPELNLIVIAHSLPSSCSFSPQLLPILSPALAHSLPSSCSFSPQLLLILSPALAIILSPALAVRGPPISRSSRAVSPPPGQPGGGTVNLQLVKYRAVLVSTVRTFIQSVGLSVLAREKCHIINSLQVFVLFFVLFLCSFFFF
jgi:hypothetical protein